MFTQTQGEQETNKGPTVICKVKENNNNNNHLHRAYSTLRCNTEPVLTSSYLFFLTLWEGGIITSIVQLRI